MFYKKYQADYIFPISQTPLKKGILITDEKGCILEIANEGLYAEEDIEYYSGIICPGFINAHCHLELSHLKGLIPEHTGLAEFIKPISSIRREYEIKQILRAIRQAEAEMIKNGIVGLGDISNEPYSLPQKEMGNLQYHTFIEVLGMSEKVIGIRWEEGQVLFELIPSNTSASLSPHAPYSTNDYLINTVDTFNRQHLQKTKNLLSIHNQESREEEKMFMEGKGDLIDFYIHYLQFPIHDFFTPPQTSSLVFTLKNLSPETKTLLVHNTFTSKKDIQFAHQYSEHIHWCFCPNANLYIENQLPNFNLFRSEKAKILVGTDSLCSNHQLCIMSELKTIHQHFPDIPLSELLQWATLNGASYFGWDEKMGSFETGKQPGLNRIKNINLDNLILDENCTIERLDISTKNEN